MRRQHILQYLYLYCCYYHQIDISADGLYVPAGIAHSVVCALVLIEVVYHICLLKFTVPQNSNVNFPESYVILSDFGYSVKDFWLICFQILLTNQAFKFSTMDLPGGYSRSASCSITQISTLHCFSTNVDIGEDTFITEEGPNFQNSKWRTQNI